MTATLTLVPGLVSTLSVEAPDGLGLLHLRHPGYAPEATIEPGEPPYSAVDAALQELANQYLQQLAAAVPALQPVVVTLTRQPPADFGWLPLAWGLAAPLPADLNPVRSYLLTRGPAEAWTEASLVLLAARRLQGKAVGDGVGLRVTAHVQRKAPGSPWRLRFTSLAGSRLDKAGQALPEWLKVAAQPARATEIRRRLGEAFEARHAAVHSIEALDDAGQLCRVHGVATRTPPGFSRAHVFGYEALVDLKRSTVKALDLQPLSARALELHLFERDPASVGDAQALAQRRPSAADAVLDGCREFRSLVPDGLNPALLALKDLGDLFVVTHERRPDLGQPDTASVVPGDKVAALPPKLGIELDPLKVLPLRSDDLAAAQAYLRARELFERLEAYGFNIPHYFRHARLPLELRPRARMAGAPDGRTVNAEVRPFYRNTVPEVDLLSNAASAPFANGQRPQLLVRLGSADTKVRRGRQTLGLAIDPRWTWHEFGHVLNFGATGELEFGFAHSAGDALAAIAADPDSSLATDAELRGVTFPWAYAARRHDRQARQGYCWCGEQTRLRLLTASTNHHRHAYFEEQVLSSSLFRLYRSLGGATGAGRTENQPGPDTDADMATRRSAADYCIYLIMRAIALLGPNVVVPSQTVDPFVGALIDADIGTGTWQIEAAWPYRTGSLRRVRRQGGRVHKVIRWCFEQQGLYATGAAAEGPGLPPVVDVYIADRRDGPPGGYTPVSLRGASDGQSAWHAAAQAMMVDDEGRLTVRAGQRGQRQAQDLSMRVWLSPVGSKRLQWTALQEVRQADAQTFQARLPGQKVSASCWVLAAIDSASDPSNLGLGDAPPDTLAELTELVAHDNNLGLARLG